MQKKILVIGFLIMFAVISVVYGFTNGENAVDCLGQVDTATPPNPVYTRGEPNNGLNDRGFYYPYSVAIDTVGHRLFIADTENNRVLVYNLDTNNNLIDRIADNVLGQPDFTSWFPATTQSGLRYPCGLAYDSTNNRLFVADTSNNRVVVYDVTTITNGENAINVLGQTDFTSNTPATTQ